jgi:hypothetical protein
MTLPAQQQAQTRPVPGVIDTLSAGYQAVNRRPGLIAIPLLLDLFLWLGPRLSIAPLMRHALALYDLLLQQALAGATVSTEQASQLQAASAQVRQVAEQGAASFNLFSLLASGRLGVPSLLASVTPKTGFWSPPVATMDNGLVFLGLAIVLLLAGLLIGALYLGAITQGVRDDRFAPALLLRQVWRYWAQVVAYLALIVSLIFLLGTPYAFVLGLATLFSPLLGSFLLGLAWVIGIWAAIYLFFALSAIFVSEVGPLQAIWHSFNIVRFNLWSTLGLIIIISVIGLGMPLLWEIFVGNPWGVLAGIAGNAYIGTGLSAASLIFYRHRYAYWQAQLAAVREAARQ